MNNEFRFSTAWRRRGAFAVLATALALFAALPAFAWPWQKETPTPPSRWRDLPFCAVDPDLDEEIMGHSKGYVVTLPIPERVVLLPVVENCLWNGERLPLAVADPIAFDNPGTVGLRELFAPLETDGQRVAKAIVLAKRHAPATTSPAPINYFMQTMTRDGREYLGEIMLRLPHAHWEGVRRSLEAELARDSLVIAPGWPTSTSIDDVIASTNVLSARAYEVSCVDTYHNNLMLWPWDPGTVVPLCFTDKGRQTLREELLEPESPEAFAEAAKRAGDARRAEEDKTAAEYARNQREWLENVRRNAAAAPVPPAMTLKLKGGATMTMVWCPPGNFWMGSPPDEAGRRDGETRHRVTLTRGFWMAATEVTQKQWESVMGNNPSEHQGGNLPAENVSWYEALSFCLRSGHGLQLPTEAQWEYACRAGSETPHGGTGVLDGMGWFGGNSETKPFWGEPRKESHPVGQKTPNAWGLHDMHGNVTEWCSDVLAPYPDGDATDPAGPDAGKRRVLRGGAWFSDAKDCRSASRGGGAPPMDGHAFCSFRPVLVAPSGDVASSRIAPSALNPDSAPKTPLTPTPFRGYPEAYVLHNDRRPFPKNEESPPIAPPVEPEGEPAAPQEPPAQP